MIRTTLVMVAVVPVLVATTTGWAQQTFKKCSFESWIATGGQYFDTDDPAVDHALINNVGEPVVTGNANLNEIGFRSLYTNSRDDVGLTDGDFFGVTDFTGNVGGSFPDGTRAYEMQDCDGTVTVVFDSVNLSARSRPRVTLDLFIFDTSWEVEPDPVDRVRVWIETNDGTEIDLINSDGLDIDNLGVEGQWLTLGTDLTGWNSATLRVELEGDRADESIYIDNVKFIDDSGGPSLELRLLASTCPETGPAVLEARGTAGAQTVFFYSLAQGSSIISSGDFCVGTILDLAEPYEVGAIGRGEPAQITIPKVPGERCGGAFIQAVDLETCGVSNVVIID